MAKVVCVGSLNHDIALWVPHRPGPDETLHGQRMAEFRGGKGANQIVAASRLGAEATMIGCVGADSRGDFLLEGLDLDGVMRSAVERVDDPTGVAVIIIDPDDVSIVVVAGANAAVDVDRVEAQRDVIADADVLLLQGEIPANPARRAAEIARSEGTTVVFNPAPFNDVARAVAPLADVVIVNQQEALQLAEAAIDLPATTLVVTTLGSSGCAVKSAAGTELVPPFTADVVDPTGAGDCFAAALAVALAEGKTPSESASFANAAGSIAVETAGAQPSLPTRDIVLARMER